MGQSLLDLISLGADISQFISLQQNLSQTTQLEIMQRFDKQDDTLFALMIENQNKIMERLDRLEGKQHENH